MIHTIGKPEPEIPTRVPVPDFAHLLPEPIQRFTTKGVYNADEETHLSFTQAAATAARTPTWSTPGFRRSGASVPPCRRRDLGQLDDGRHLRP